MKELERQAHDRALAITNEAVRKLERLEPMEDETFEFELERSLTAMRELAAQIQQQIGRASCRERA